MRRSFRLAAAALLVAACSNAGSDRVLTVPGTGRVQGFIFLDRNGDTAFGGLPDVALAAARIRLIALGTVDTAAKATSDTGSVFAGSPSNFSFLGVPVGTYRVAVDTTTVPRDSMLITRMDSTVTITPGETTFVRVAISFPAVTPAGARTLPLRTKVFVVGVALMHAGQFGDSTGSIADPAGSGAIRVTLIKPTTVIQPGDSDRILATVDTLDGQRVLRFVSVFQLNNLGPPAATPITVLTVGKAKIANGGGADAALVGIQGRVAILDTATLNGSLIMQVTDTTGTLQDTLEVRLDTLAGFLFRTDSVQLKGDVPGARVHLTGMLFPSSVPGRWLLKPRAPADQTP